MLKRILALVAVLVVVFACAAPCLASGTDGLTNRVYSCFPIDTVVFNNGSSVGHFVEWPCNEIKGRSSFVHPNGGYFSYGLSGYAISGEMGFGDATSVTFHSRLTYLDSFTYFVLSFIESPSDLTFTRVRLDFDVVDVADKSGNYHDLVTKHVSFDSLVHGLKSQSEVDVVEYIIEACELLGFDPRVDPRVLLHDFDLTIDFYFDPDPSVYRYIGFSLGSNTNPNSFLLGWFNGLRLSKSFADAEDFSLVWLANSVSGFLTFEIFPGFTLNTLLHVAIIAGLTLFLIRLIS